MCLKNLFQSETMDMGMTTKFNSDHRSEQVHSP